MLDLALRAILGSTMVLNSSKLKFDCSLSFLRKSRATSSALTCLRPDLVERVMILSRESTKEAYLNSLVKSYFLIDRFTVLARACLAAALAISLPTPFAAAAMGFNRRYSADMPPPDEPAAIGFSLLCSAVRPPPPADAAAIGFSLRYSAVIPPPLLSSAPAAMGFRRRYSADMPLLESLSRSAFDLGLALDFDMASGAIESGCPLITSLLPPGDRSI